MAIPAHAFRDRPSQRYQQRRTLRYSLTASLTQALSTVVHGVRLYTGTPAYRRISRVDP